MQNWYCTCPSTDFVACSLLDVVVEVVGVMHKSREETRATDKKQHLTLLKKGTHGTNKRHKILRTGVYKMPAFPPPLIPGQAERLVLLHSLEELQGRIDGVAEGE